MQEYSWRFTREYLPELQRELGLTENTAQCTSFCELMRYCTSQISPHETQFSPSLPLQCVVYPVDLQNFNQLRQKEVKKKNQQPQKPGRTIVWCTEYVHTQCRWCDSLLVNAFNSWSNGLNQDCKMQIFITAKKLDCDTCTCMKLDLNFAQLMVFGDSFAITCILYLEILCS